MVTFCPSCKPVTLDLEKSRGRQNSPSPFPALKVLTWEKSAKDVAFAPVEIKASTIWNGGSTFFFVLRLGQRGYILSH
jgi:hypothetical protein